MGQMHSVDTWTMQVWEGHLLFRHKDLCHLELPKSSYRFVCTGACSAPSLSAVIRNHADGAPGWLSG